MKDIRAKLDARIAEIQRAYKALEESRESVARERAGLDRKMAEIAQEQLRLDGEYRGLKSLAEDSAPDKEN